MMIWEGTSPISHTWSPFCLVWKLWKVLCCLFAYKQPLSARRQNVKGPEISKCSAFSNLLTLLIIFLTDVNEKSDLCDLSYAFAHDFTVRTLALTGKRVIDIWKDVGGYRSTTNPAYMIDFIPVSIDSKEDWKTPITQNIWRTTVTLNVFLKLLVCIVFKNTKCWHLWLQQNLSFSAERW